MAIDEKIKIFQLAYDYVQAYMDCETDNERTIGCFLGEAVASMRIIDELGLDKEYLSWQNEIEYENVNTKG